MILGAQGYGYFLTQLLGGVLSGKFGGKWIYGVGVVGGCIMTLLNPVMAFASGTGIAYLFIVRAIQGLFQVTNLMEKLNIRFC